MSWSRKVGNHWHNALKDGGGSCVKKYNGSRFHLWKSTVYHLHFMQIALDLRLQQNGEFSFSDKLSEKSHFHRNASANPTVESAFSHESALDR